MGEREKEVEEERKMRWRKAGEKRKGEMEENEEGGRERRDIEVEEKIKEMKRWRKNGR